MNKDWDVLIILDACRNDMFSKCCDINGDLSTKVSRGSNTKEFLYGNFHDGTWLDTVYTTANPQFYRYKDEINAEFYEVYNVWNSDLWDEDVGTVLPSDMTNVTIQKIEQHPHKRHIVHYLQPHYPFINTELENIGRNMLDSGNDQFNLWGLQARGELNIPNGKINKAYYKNLELVFDAVKDLCNNISGKIIITSDHGNMLNERSRPLPIKEWGHPSGIYTPELVEVPWLVVEKGKRPEIHAEERVQRQENVNDEVVDARLKDLGYI